MARTWKTRKEIEEAHDASFALVFDKGVAKERFRYYQELHQEIALQTQAALRDLQMDAGANHPCVARERMVYSLFPFTKDRDGDKMDERVMMQQLLAVMSFVPARHATEVVLEHRDGIPQISWIGPTSDLVYAQQVYEYREHQRTLGEEEKAAACAEASTKLDNMPHYVIAALRAGMAPCDIQPHIYRCLNVLRDFERLNWKNPTE